MAKKRSKTTDEHSVPTAEAGAVEEAEAKVEETDAVVNEPIPPTDFAMTLGEYAVCRDIRPSTVAGLRAFLLDDRPRKLSAWDEALEKFKNI
jgi:hypothetical protein